MHIAVSSMRTSTVPGHPRPSPLVQPILRPPLPAETPILIEIAVSTGLFTLDEAEGLLGGVLRSLHAGELGAEHHVRVWSPSPDAAPAGWTYFSPDTFAPGVWNLWWIGVAPSHHGAGGGDALLSAAEAAVTAAGARLLVIETSALPPLARARAFYERRGYLNCGQVPDFYGAGDDKIIFARPMVAAVG
jgi:ribosomal protein S18 acetylase RimI-like enzyme